MPRRMLARMGEGRFLVVTADGSPAVSFDIEREVIEAAGATLEIRHATTDEGLIESLQDADAVLVLQAQMTRPVSEALERCKLYVRYGVGLDSIDVPAATDNDIVVAYFPDYCQDEVANHTIMLLLASAKKLSWLDRTIRTGRWRPGGFGVMGPITGETLGLVGFGNIAREVVPRARALGLQLIGCDPYIPDEPFTALGVERVESLDELLARSDYVSIHTPLTAETRHHFGRAQFEKMKPSAYLLNTSRGPVIDEEALVEALQEGQIAGAGLDVYENEPLAADSPLLQMDNVVLTPHSAAYSNQAIANLRRRVGQACVDIMQGRWPSTVANPGVKPKVALQVP